MSTSDSRHDPRFVSPKYRVPERTVAELYAEGKRRDGRQEADNRRHDADEDVDLPTAAQSFLATMKANRTPEQQRADLIRRLQDRR